MNRLSLMLFLGLLFACAFFALNSVGELPEKVATHFDAKGVADQWTDRDHYVLSMLSLLVSLPTLLVLATAILPRYTNGKGQIPNCEYWFAHERRRLTETFLMSHAYWLGCLTIAVIFGIHISILRANATTPALLAIDRLYAMLVAYLCGLVWWTMAFLRHFKGR